MPNERVTNAMHDQATASSIAYESLWFPNLAFDEIRIETRTVQAIKPYVI